MIFKPFVLLASALATLQVANGAAIAERATSLCCPVVVNPPIVATLAALITPLLSGTGVTLNTGLAVGALCTPLSASCAAANSLTCDIDVSVPLLEDVGVNCSPA
ncbi:hypothetical protein R3P38DRAFT_3181755 [Favolaschia claudopus]|uniref:Hydrophobin n=1 Tax=Favolaschia claudopus TaxID=2862362 RepID=A0AAW0CPL5_9AGAR